MPVTIFQACSKTNNAEHSTTVMCSSRYETFFTVSVFDFCNRFRNCMEAGLSLDEIRFDGHIFQVKEGGPIWITSEGAWTRRWLRLGDREADSSRCILSWIDTHFMRVPGEVTYERRLNKVLHRVHHSSGPSSRLSPSIDLCVFDVPSSGSCFVTGLKYWGNSIDYKVRPQQTLRPAAFPSKQNVEGFAASPHQRCNSIPLQFVQN